MTQPMRQRVAEVLGWTDDDLKGMGTMNQLKATEKLDGIMALFVEVMDSTYLRQRELIDGDV